MTTRSTTLHREMARSSAGRSMFMFMTRRDLILYATPEGDLAEQCQRFFELLRDSGRGTTAQTYPTHISLTGFFRRTADGVDRAVADVQRARDVAAAGSVVVNSLMELDDWLGLDIASGWLSSIATSVADSHRLDPGDDPIRLKDWLHLSLAYGDVPAAVTIAELAELARSMISIEAEVQWSVGLWERRGSTWSRLA